MRMHNVITRATRLSKNINDTLQIIQFGPESENIDDVDRMAEPAQLLCLLPHESSIIWPLRSGVHIRDKEYSHRSALLPSELRKHGRPFAFATARLYRFTVSSTILAVENLR